MKLLVKTYKIADLPESKLITNVFLKPEFLNLLTKFFNLDVKYLVVKNLQLQEVVAVSVSIEKKILGIPSLINPKILYYQPVEVFASVRKNQNENNLQQLEIFQKISEYYHKYYFKIEKNLPPEIEDIRGFLWSGLTATPFYTYRLNLNDYSSECFFRKQRAALRKAQNLSYEFTQDIDIDSFMELVQGTKERQEWNFDYKDEVLRKYLNELLELGFVKQFSIKNQEGRIVSTMFCQMDKINKVSYAWFTSTDVNELSNGVSTLLFHSISEYLKTEYVTFDLCGANTETIARFKASLGAQLKVFYRIKL